MAQDTRPLALVTGASTGIGYELAKMLRRNGFDLVSPPTNRITQAADDSASLARWWRRSRPISRRSRRRAALSAPERGRPVDALIANAGRGLGNVSRSGFRRREAGRRYQHHRHALSAAQGRPRHARRGQGRILIIGSIAGFMPGTFQAVYNGTKAFLDSSPSRCAHELKDSGVTVTCLMPGATETDSSSAPTCWTPRSAAEEGRSGRCRAGRFEAMMQRRRRCRHRLAEQAAGRDRQHHPGRPLAERYKREAKPGTAAAG